MGKIERLDTSRNVECFPRTLNRQNADKAYFIDSQRNTSAFKRLFTTSKAKKIVIEQATREPVKSATALSEAERLTQELK